MADMMAVWGVLSKGSRLATHFQLQPTIPPPFLLLRTESQRSPLLARLFLHLSRRAHKRKLVLSFLESLHLPQSSPSSTSPPHRLLVLPPCLEAETTPGVKTTNSNNSSNLSKEVSLVLQLQQQEGSVQEV